MAIKCSFKSAPATSLLRVAYPAKCGRRLSPCAAQRSKEKKSARTIHAESPFPAILPPGRIYRWKRRGRIVIQLGPVRRRENTIAVGPCSVVRGHTHEHDHAAVVLRIRDDKAAVEGRLLAFECRAELDHAPAKISSS